jgi:hypothetical protein
MSSVEQIRKELEAFYKSYVAAINGKDVSAISECFACPGALITGQGVYQWVTETTSNICWENLWPTSKNVDGRAQRSFNSRYGRWPKIWPCFWHLFKANGSVLEQVRPCYTVRRDAENWKIVTVSEVAPPFLGPGDLPR